MSERPVGAAGAAEPVLFSEPGARWRTVAFGPAIGAVGLAIEVSTGPVVHWAALAGVAAALAGFGYLLTFAACRHASVELTATTLRQGTEEVPLTEIEELLPEAARDTDPQPWETARPLGELTGVPRGRTGIGLRLRGGTLVRAWAKNDEGLRAELARALAGAP